MRKYLILGLLAMSAMASAQSRSSFQSVQSVSGLVTTINGVQLTLNVGATPTFVKNNTTYHITEVFAVYALDNNDDMSATGGTQNGWSFDTNYSGTGGIAGWKTNPNNGFINDTKVFNYTALNGTVENVGWHVRIAEQFQGSNTLYIENPVPEPGTIAALGLGAVALIRRRKKA